MVIQSDSHFSAKYVYFWQKSFSIRLASPRLLKATTFRGSSSNAKSRSLMAPSATEIRWVFTKGFGEAESLYWSNPHGIPKTNSEKRIFTILMGIYFSVLEDDYISESQLVESLRRLRNLDNNLWQINYDVGKPFWL